MAALCVLKQSFKTTGNFLFFVNSDTKIEAERISYRQ